MDRVTGLCNLLPIQIGPFYAEEENKKETTDAKRNMRAHLIEVQPFCRGSAPNRRFDQLDHFLDCR